MSKKEKNVNNYYEAKFAVFLNTLEGPVPMKHLFMGMSNQERNVFAMSVVAILQTMGFDPDETGLEIYVSRIDQQAKMSMTRS